MGPRRWVQLRLGVALLRVQLTSRRSSKCLRFACDVMCHTDARYS